jgi:hypothetical protein
VENVEHFGFHSIAVRQTARLLEQRIAYHRRLIAEEKARRQLPWYRRIFAA